MGRTLSLAALSLTAYVVVSSLLHFVVFPEPAPPPDDRPRSGMEVHLPGGSTFVYRLTAVETDGQIFEADWLGDPGAGIPRHTHPSQQVEFEVVEGSLLVTVGAEDRLLGPGEEVVIPAGVEHLWENASEARSRGVFRIRPAGMADFVFVQLDRAFGGEANALSTAIQTFILIGTHGKHTAWPIKTLCFLIAPTARLFGYRSYYEPAASGESNLNGRTHRSHLSPRTSFTPVGSRPFFRAHLIGATAELETAARRKQPFYKPMKRRLNFSISIPALPLGIDPFRLGDLGGAMLRRLSLIC